MRQGDRFANWKDGDRIEAFKMVTQRRKLLPDDHPPRAAPLAQLMALAFIPLELELLRLLLAGSAFGPSPALERLLVWCLSVVAPGYWLVRRPVDWGSLLLLRQPLSTRQVDQRRISALQQSPGLQIATVFGMVLLLVVFWWIDQSALLVIDLSPLGEGSRLTGLLLSGLVLSLLLWQWQQLCSSLWLLTPRMTTCLPLSPSTTIRCGAVEPVSAGLLTLPTLRWSSLNEGSGLGSGRSNQSKLPKRTTAPTWISRSLGTTGSPALSRKVMTKRPRPPEPNKATQRRRLSPRQGVRDS